MGSRINRLRCASLPVGKAKGEDFWGVDQDVKSVGAFIKRWVTENGRWGSPKYVLGESYGGMRSAALVYHLQTTQGMDLNGVVLVSPFLNAGSGIDGEEIDLPHVLYLPTFAATAWYHDAIPNKPASLPAYLEEVERFAYDVYAPALTRGYLISEADKKAVAAKLAAYTGTKQAVAVGNGTIAILDDKGRTKDAYQPVYGARLKVEDGQRVASGQVLVEWDPFTTSILTEHSGTVHFRDVLEGVTMKEEFDESLKMMETDYVDIYYVHAPDADTAQPPLRVEVRQAALPVGREGNVRDVDAGVEHPNIVSESGRATITHHSILVFNVLDVRRFEPHTLPPLTS